MKLLSSQAPTQQTALYKNCRQNSQICRYSTEHKHYKKYVLMQNDPHFAIHHLQLTIISCAGSNHPLSQLTLWTRSQNPRGHLPPSPAVPHRPVTRLPPTFELEVMSRPPSETGGLTNSVGTTVHQLLTSGGAVHTWTLWGNAMVLANHPKMATAP